MVIVVWMKIYYSEETSNTGELPTPFYLALLLPSNLLCYICNSAFECISFGSETSGICKNRIDQLAILTAVSEHSAIRIIFYLFVRFFHFLKILSIEFQSFRLE
jgi:hypothetical protein